MSILWRCSAHLLVFFVIDSAFSVLTQRDRGPRSPVDNILLTDKKSDERFSIDLTNERRNASVVFNDKETNRDDGRRIKNPKEFGGEKKPRTFLGPLSLDFKDKLNPKRGIIYDTRDSSGGGFSSGFSCCGSRYGSPSYSDNERPEYVYGDSSGGGRYSSRPSGRPSDGLSYGSSGSSYPLGVTGGGSRPGGDSWNGGGSYPSRYGPNRGSYGGNSDDRYSGSRPGYGSGGSSNSPIGPSGSYGAGGLYGRPSFSIGGYGGLGGTYGGSSQGGGLGGGHGGQGGSGSDGGSYGGGFGGSGYGGGGLNGFENGGNNGQSGFGGFGSPGDYGGGGDFGYGGGGGGMTGHSSGGNLQTQKALALKALAGVALIGAAAALATNPVLLPLGIAHGRKRRSTADDFWNEHPLMLLKEYISKIPRNDIKKEDIAVLSKFLTSRKCVARLACEVQREYSADLAKYKNIGDRENSIYHNLENRFMDLVQSNILNNNYVNQHLKKEIKLALAIGAQEGNCNVFPCTLPRS